MDGVQQSPVELTRPTFFPYAPSTLRRDEAMTNDGAFRDGWEPIFESCGRYGLNGLADWRREAARLSHERGLAYRPGEGENSDWKLDPIPWIVGQDDWAKIETGMQQRIRLYEALLADLYGKQHVLRSGIVPTSIIFGHPRYLRPCHDLSPGQSLPVQGLGMTSFDLARDRGGNMFTVDGHFDAPFGLGLALETRTVINKTLPNLFRRCQVRQIGHFYRDWFDYLNKLAPKGITEPRIVILDRDRNGEHSEMSFLANYCGIVRVHPSDLTVRGGKVWLKALHGLEPVHVIWRAQEGINLDPLEVQNWSRFGISGLFSAMRLGNVAVVSHPGCGVLRSAGLYPFLGALSRELLGENLIVPPVATWWCGSADSLSHVVDNLPSMVVKEVATTGKFPTAYGQRLTTSGLDQLRSQILAEPNRFVAQEEIAISTIPSSTAEGLVPRGAVMRCFAFADADGRAKVMPGGLGRVSAESGVIVSTRKAGIARDIWVQSDRTEQAISVAEGTVAALCRDQAEVVPSRTAENLFWAGRNAERAEAIAHFIERLLRGREKTYTYGEEVETRHETILLETLFKTFKTKSPKAGGGTMADRDQALATILGSKSSSVSLSETLQKLQANSAATREIWSPASLLAINSATGAWPAINREDFTLAQLEEPLQKLQLGLSAFLGCNLDSMTRDAAWILLDAGRRVERCFFQVEILHHAYAEEATGSLDTLLNESLLYISDSLRTYQQTFYTIPCRELTLCLLLSKADYPRSLHYQLERLDRLLLKLPKPIRGGHPHELIGPMRDELQQFSARLACTSAGESTDRSAILDYLKKSSNRVLELSSRITTAYFSHAQNQAQL